MRISFRMVVLSLVLFLSEVCVNLSAVNNQTLILEDDDNEENNASDGIVSLLASDRWVEGPENA